MIKLEMKNYALILVVSLICLISAGVLPTWLEEAKLYNPELVGKVLEEIGIAGLVGLVVAVTIEKSSQEEFAKLAKRERDAIATNVFHYTFGRKVPKELTDEIDEILETDFVRSDYSIVFDVGPLGTEAEAYALVGVTVSYKVKNISPDEKSFFPGHAAEKHPVKSLGDWTTFTSLEIPDSQPPIIFGVKPESKVPVKEEENLMWIDLPKGIPISPDRFVTVKLTYQFVAPRKLGKAAIAVTSYVLDFDISVQVPDGGKWLVWAGNNCRLPLKLGNRHRPAAGRYHWMIDGPLLPYQGIELTWYAE